MTMEQFIAWRLEHGIKHAELDNGVPVVAQAQTVRHSERKAEIRQALRNAIAAAGLPCRPLMEMLVPIGGLQGKRSYEPDVLVQCGEPPSPDAITIPDPLIVFELVSPSSGRIDTVLKMPWYFSLPSVLHYIIVEPQMRFLVWHARETAEAIIQTRILREGPMRLDPPGVWLDAGVLIGPDLGPKLGAELGAELPT